MIYEMTKIKESLRTFAYTLNGMIKRLEKEIKEEERG